MDILINGSPLDFTLESEKTLQEVIHNLESWLISHQLYISEIQLDGRTVSLNDDAPWLLEPFMNDTKLDIEALHPRDLKIKHIATIISFFQMYQRALSAQDSDRLKDLANEAAFVLSSLPAALEGPNGEMVANHTESLMEETGVLKGKALSHESTEKLLVEWGHIIRLLDSRIKELENPLMEAGKTSSAIQDLIPQIEEISVYLQTGKDREAMGLIIQLTELIQKIIRISFLLQNADNNSSEFINEFASDLNGILRELEEAFQNEDSVLIGDLIEYELITRLQNIPEFLDKFKVD